MENKKAYPVILKPESDGSYYVRIPDFDTGTQGENVADAMEMARDAMGLMMLSKLDNNEEIPEPYSADVETEIEKGDIVTLVDIDFDDYRKKYDTRAVKKNCSVPYWMTTVVERNRWSYSKLLQKAILEELDKEGDV